jgi:squalene-hopene/tetraprenyl-beta-curcumene cyclase
MRARSSKVVLLLVLLFAASPALHAENVRQAPQAFDPKSEEHVAPNRLAELVTRRRAAGVSDFFGQGGRDFFGDRLPRERWDIGARQSPRSGGESATWNPGKAARYLDERQQVWFGHAKCVSCHSGLPYALSRAALRKVVGSKTPGEPETKLLAQIRRRVENWKNLDTKEFGLYYDSSDEKKKQSWGTEAVFNTAILAFADRYEGRSTPSAATKQALSNLWQTQVQAGENKGTWDWLDFNEAPWGNKEARYFGAALAAVAVGTAPGYYTPGADADTEAKVALLRGYLHDGLRKQNLHNRAWGLWAATQVDGILSKAEQKKVIDQLFDKQQDGGGWSLPTLGTWVRSDRTAQETSSDGYATGLVLHVLQTAGMRRNHGKVAKGLDWLKQNQAAAGAWRTVSVVKKRDPATHSGKFMSDATTAFAVLALRH